MGAGRAGLTVLAVATPEIAPQKPNFEPGYRRRPAAVGTYLERHASSPHKSRGDDNTRANTAHHPVRSVSALATLGQQTRGARRNCRVSHPHTVRRRSSPPIAARFSFVRMATGAPRRVMRVGIRLYSGQERTGLKIGLPRAISIRSGALLFAKVLGLDWS